MTKRAQSRDWAGSSISRRTPREVQAEIDTLNAAIDSHGRNITVGEQLKHDALHSELAEINTNLTAARSAAAVRQGQHTGWR